MKETPQIITMLTGALTVLGAVIVWLALYIRKLHNQAMKTGEANRDIILKVVEKTTEVMADVNATIHNNTVATTNGAEQTTRAMDRLGGVVNDLHKTILTQNRRGE